MLTVVISTQAGSDSDLLSTLIDDAAAGHDPGTVVSLYSAPKDADPFAESTIRAVNPSFDLLMNPVELLAMAAADRRLLAREASYRRYCWLNREVACRSHPVRCLGAPRPSVHYARPHDRSRFLAHELCELFRTYNIQRVA